MLTNKYAEGYPGKRYYGGCEFVDVAESLAIARAKQLFGAEHANVQPHSGAQANMAVYFTLLKPGDTVLGMNLAHGGHLTHGHPLNFSGKLYTIVPYGVRKDDERIDYDELERLAHEHKPKMIMVGASAYPRVIDFARIGAVGKAIGAPVVTDMAHIAGLVAAGVHPSPVPHSDFVTTTTHKTLRGPRGGMVLCRAQYAKDLDRTVFPGIQGGPLMHIIAAKAVCFKEALEPAFADYQRQIVANAKRLAAALSAPGFRLVSGGTDNHLMLVDVFSKGLTGKVAEAALGKAGITVNKNAIPFDQNPPMVASGIRIGTPAITTRGMREPEMDTIARIHRARAGVARRRGGAGTREGGSRGPVPEVPAVPGEAGAERASRRSSRPAVRCRSRSTASRRARRSSRWRRPSPTSSPTAACCSPKRAPAPARRSPISSPRSSAASACSSRPAPRTSRSRSSSRTCRSCARRSASRSPPTYMKGRGNYLCLHRFDALKDGAGDPVPRRDAIAIERDRRVVARHRDRRSRRDRGSAGGPAVLDRHLGDQRELHRRRLPALQRLLRDEDAPARRRVRRRDRQPSPALRRRRRCGRARSAR